jgi:hypothetical protein
LTCSLPVRLRAQQQAAVTPQRVPQQVAAGAPQVRVRVLRLVAAVTPQRVPPQPLLPFRQLYPIAHQRRRLYLHPQQSMQAHLLMGH